MATLTPVIVPAKALRNGKHKIRIAVAHNSNTRYILTDIVIDSDKEFKRGQVIKRPDANFLNLKIRKVIADLSQTIDSLEYTEGLSCAELIASIKAKEASRNRTLKSVFEEYIANFTGAKRTIEAKKDAWRVISKVVKADTMVQNISHADFLKFQKKCTAWGFKTSTISGYTNQFKALINYAIQCGYARYDVKPHQNIKVSRGMPKDSWLTIEQLVMVRDCKVSKRLTYYRDLFVLSFYLGGINLVDLFNIRFTPGQRRLKYKRTKTKGVEKINEYVEFDMPDEAMAIIGKYLAKDGSILPKHTTYHTFQRRVVYAMERIREANEIDNLVFYSARKSFSQIAFNNGIPTSVIDYILGHALSPTKRSLYAYISVTPDMATDALKKVLEILK